MNHRATKNPRPYPSVTHSHANDAAHSTGSAAAASLLLPLLEPRYAQAQQVAGDDARLETGRAR